MSSWFAFLLLVLSGHPLFANGTPELSDALPSNFLCKLAFRRIFHGVAIDASSVTTSRKERRRTVPSAIATDFLSSVNEVVGSERVKKRDVPETAGTVYVTDTDYLPKFRGLDRDGNDLHKARIRIRQYFEVPEGTLPADLRGLTAADLKASKLADGEGPFVKLEFKAGKPQAGEDGDLIDTELVVEKPGITIARSDVDLLLASPDSYRRHHAAVLARAKALTLTKDGVRKEVNFADTVEAMIQRIGLLHEQGWEEVKMRPQTNMRYQREAYRVLFPNPESGKKPIEVQITFDKGVIETALRSGAEHVLSPDLRVVELKIPEEFADLPDNNLAGLGLGELAKIRAKFLGLKEAENAVPDASKPSNLRRLGAEESN